MKTNHYFSGSLHTKEANILNGTAERSSMWHNRTLRWSEHEAIRMTDGIAIGGVIVHLPWLLMMSGCFWFMAGLCDALGCGIAAFIFNALLFLTLGFTIYASYMVVRAISVKIWNALVKPHD